MSAHRTRPPDHRPRHRTHPCRRRADRRDHRVRLPRPPALVDEAGIPLILVGDSLAQVMLGYDTTVRVSMDEMLHHTKAVVRGTKRALIVADMPFLTYSNTEDAIANAGRFMREAGTQAVKLEGGVRQREDDRGAGAGRNPGHGPHRPHAPGDQHAGQGPGPGQEPRAGAPAPRRRPRRPGGRRLRGRAWSSYRSSSRPPSPSASASRRSGSARAPGAPGRSRSSPTRWGSVTGRRSTRGSTRTCTGRSSPRSANTATDVEAGTFPGEAETVRMDEAVLDDVLGRSDDDRAYAEPLAGIPLDRDL